MCGTGSAVGHPWHPGGGGVLDTVVFTLATLPLCHSTNYTHTHTHTQLHAHTHTHTPPYRHTYRVFFSQRVYKELTLTHAPLLPAIRDAHVGSHNSWALEDNYVIVL